jgi:signal transduction histidine kinase
MIGRTARGAVVIYEEVAEEIRIERVKRDILAAVAHELRTPTTIVKGYAQRLSRTPGRSEDERRALCAMDRAASRIERLTQDLIDLSSITLGRIILSMTHADMAEIVLHATERALGARTHRVCFVPSTTSAFVFVDALRIQRVIRELIENAARSSHPGSEIDVELRVGNGTVDVLVRDHGIGIPEHARSRMFEPLFRAHAGMPDELGGLGIGLFLAREVVMRHGGSLTFESKEGEGSTFKVTLPLDKEYA